MTLRETIANLIWEAGAPDPKSAADAILAAIREHMTSPEAVGRAYMAGTLEMSPEENMREAILAALGEGL